MAAKTTVTTDVEIFGSTYHVRGENDPEHLREVAALVDRRMREIAEKVATVDTAKIAILAALNIADELFRERRGENSTADDGADALLAQRIIERIDAVLDGES